jgi:hypothetical protein
MDCTVKKTYFYEDGALWVGHVTSEDIHLRAQVFLLRLWNSGCDWAIITFVWMQNLLKQEIQNVISGKSQVRFGAAIQTVAGYLSTSTKSGTSVEGTKSLKQQETMIISITICR